MWLNQVYKMPSPHATPALVDCHGIVIHNTGSSANATQLALWAMGELRRQRRTPKVSWHFIIGRDGKLIQQVSLARQAWHAGVSEWAPRPRRETVSSLNRHTIGIELANGGRSVPGDEATEATLHWHSTSVPPVTSTWEPYTHAQITALCSLIRDLRPFGVPSLLVGHEDVAMPLGRKEDPGPLFPWRRVLAETGAEGGKIL